MLYFEKIMFYFEVFIVGYGISYLLEKYIFWVCIKFLFINRKDINSLELFERKKCCSAILGGISVIYTYIFYASFLNLVIILIFINMLLLISFVDIATMEIPNTFVIAALVLGIISIFTMPGTSLLSRILGMFVVSAPLLLITLLVPGAFGGGDIKLMAACGLFLGTKLTLLSFAFAVLTGGLYGIWLLVMKKKSGKEHFAFGPFLCLGMAAALFIGDRVWNWYAGLLYL